MKIEEKRARGRPRTGKVKMLISIDPEIKAKIDKSARLLKMTRSAYIEAIITESSR